MKTVVLLAGIFLSMSVIAEISQLKLELLLAERGDTSAQFRVATAYEFGTDVEKDLKQSFSWYMEAANQFHAPSQFKIGHFYENGLGVTKDIDTAMSWYKKAKINGSDQAGKRLNKTASAKNKKATKNKKSAKQRTLAKKQKITVSKAVPKRKVRAVKIPDIMNIVLNNKWKNKHGAADYLPSASTTCLESGNNELTCFSSKKSRKVKGKKVTYTAKSTIVGFKSNGSFKAIYNYNGISISGKKSKASDIYGLTMTEGWQEPAIAVKCQANSNKNITCFRGNKKVKFRR